MVILLCTRWTHAKWFTPRITKLEWAVTGSTAVFLAGLVVAEPSPTATACCGSRTSLYLGGLRGNVGNLNYDVPASFALSPGDWTVLVWCEAFHVEFVGATLTVT